MDAEKTLNFLLFMFPGIISIAIIEYFSGYSVSDGRFVLFSIAYAVIIYYCTNFLVTSRHKKKLRTAETAVPSDNTEPAIAQSSHAVAVNAPDDTQTATTQPKQLASHPALQWTRLTTAISVPFSIGLAVLTLYALDNDIFVAWGNLVGMQKASAKSPLPYLINTLTRSAIYDEVDGRDAGLKPSAADRRYWPFLVVAAGDAVFVGSLATFPSNGDEQGLFLSPACERSKDGTEQHVPGPGVFVSVSQIKWLELIDPAKGSCLSTLLPK